MLNVTSKSEIQLEIEHALRCGVFQFSSLADARCAAVNAGGRALI